MSKKPSSKKSKSSVTKSKKIVGDTLPSTIVNGIPTSAAMMKHFSTAFALLPQLEKEFKRAEKAGAIPAARAFVAVHRMVERLKDMTKPLTGEAGLFETYKRDKLPALFEQEGITNVPLAEGFRVGISSRFFASINKGADEQASLELKKRAYDWLRDNGLEDIIQPVVNVSTLSATFKELIEEKNIEPPKDLFTVAMSPNTSVTKT